MTRQKKSRKIGQIGTRKQDTRPEKEKTSLRKKKAPKGQKSGNRNSLMEESLSSIKHPTSSSQKKDSKIGSKKPIDLVVTQKAPKVKPEIQHSDRKPEVILKKASFDVLTPEQELAQLENDQRLIELAERVEEGEILSGKDAKYFNKHIARYDELVEILGLEQDDVEESDPLGADQWDDLR